MRNCDFLEYINPKSDPSKFSRAGPVTWKAVNKLRLHINETQSMRQQVRIAVGQAKEDTENKVPVQHMHIVAIVVFCQNVQLPSHKKDQPGETYFFVPLNIFVLGIYRLQQ